MTLNTLRCALRGVSAYKHLMDTPLPALSLSLLDALAAGRGEEALEHYTRLYFTLAQQGYDGLGPWFADALRYQDAPYPAALESGSVSPALEAAARRDVETFCHLALLDCNALIARMRELLPAEYDPVLEELPRWQTVSPLSFSDLRAFYQKHGSGLFARHRAFLWEGGELLAIDQPDSPGPEEMMGYERQRGQVIANTRALLEGSLVNNVLLYGDSGTGKSATVKSLLSIPGFEELRLIEVEKDALADLPQLIRSLGGRRPKFILFIDDLAFDQDDRTYSALKTILEGGLERRPANVAIYATSNRRHLVRQTFSDRAGDEVDAFETIQEKTSLAERFGLRIPYLSLNKAEFLSLVDRLAQLHGVKQEPEDLHAAAIAWEMHHPGRTPRTATQFIHSLSL